MSPPPSAVALSQPSACVCSLLLGSESNVDQFRFLRRRASGESANWLSDLLADRQFARLQPSAAGLALGHSAEFTIEPDDPDRPESTITFVLIS